MGKKYDNSPPRYEDTINFPKRPIKECGPNGEYCIDYREVYDELMLKIEEPDDSGNWGHIPYFAKLLLVVKLSSNESVECESARTVPMVAMQNRATGEIKLFALRDIMPRLECFQFPGRRKWIREGKLIEVDFNKSTEEPVE